MIILQRNKIIIIILYYKKKKFNLYYIKKIQFKYNKVECNL